MPEEKEVVQKPVYRKYDKCRKCGGPFTTEHRFAKWCVKCNPKAEFYRIGKPNNTGEMYLDEREYTVRYHEYSIGIKCFKCNREIDIISGRTQLFENRCPVCKRQFDVELKVKEILTPKIKNEKKA